MHLKKNHSKTTAVLLFAQSENVESVLKPLAYSSKHNTRLWKKMNGLVISTIKKTKLPYFISDETTQVGNTFGEKITHSIQAIFAKGYEKVIIVGNDCFELKAKNILQAKLELKTSDLIIGSDYSGGTYLIGVSKSQFKDKDFEHIPWQTAHVFESLQSLYKKQSIGFLPSLRDCNSARDFIEIIGQLPYFSLLKKLLVSFLFVRSPQNNFKTVFGGYCYTTYYFNKGSPNLQSMLRFIIS
jgi:hypothetical protein